MKVLLTGATGFIGAALIPELVARGHELTILTRNPQKAKQTYGDAHSYVQWDALEGEPYAQVYQGVDAIMHLMGEGVAEKRWSAAQKKKIYDTRIVGTRNLLSGAQKHADGLKVIVAASAIGFYDHEGFSEERSEASGPGQGFMADVCADWEKEASVFKDTIRTALIRIGVVLGQGGGALKKMLPIFRLGGGGPLGSGKQWMNWIHRQDVVAIFCEALENKNMTGVYNAVSPQNHTNKSFTRCLGQVLRRPTVLPAPGFAIKLAMGEMSDILLKGQKVVPQRLSQMGFDFVFTDLKDALEESCPSSERFVAYQWLPKPPQEVFPFFSDAKNLEKITPSWLQFRVLSQSTSEIQEGTVFEYALKVHGLPLKWTSKILDWQQNQEFVDTQIKGPYALWHHTHGFVPYKGGTLMTDEVLYQVPFGALGRLALPFVKRDVEQIFAHRQKTIAKLY